MKKQKKFRDYIRIIFLKYSILTITLIFALYVLSLYFIFELAVVKGNKQSNQALSSLVEEEFTSYQDGINRLVENTAIQRSFSDTSYRWEVNDLLYSFRNDKMFKANFALLNKNGEVISTNLYEENIDALLSSYMILDVISNNDQTDMVQRTIDSNLFNHGQESSYFFAKPVWTKEKFKGYLFYFLEDLGGQFNHSESDLIVITDQFNNVLYGSDKELTTTSLGKLDVDNISGNTAVMDGKYYYKDTEKVSTKNIRVINMTSIDTFRQFVWIGLFSFLGISIVVILLIYFVLPKIMKRSLQSFDLLLRFIDKPNEVPNRQTFEEFQLIQDEFSKKITHIQTLMRDNEIIAETKRKMEVKHLETQFNPHFAFNVLEMLRYEILFDPENASDIVVSFANLLRYNMNYGNTTVPLKTDLKYVEDYLKLQKMRYDERLTYSLYIDKKVNDVEIPKLIIQPIIENSIKHCMEYINQLEIKICIRELNNCLHMTVADNGQGIEHEKLIQLKQMLQYKNNKDNLVHFGLYHSQRIIQLLYGDNYGLTIESDPAYGTTVEIKMPLRGEIKDV